MCIRDRALDLCLEQIDACRPLFIGLLGDRYGWIPSKIPDEAISKNGWIQHLTGKSITELEIIHGVLREPAMRGRAIFCFRNRGYLNDLFSPSQLYICGEYSSDEERASLTERTITRKQIRSRVLERREKLRQLKRKIREAQPPVSIVEDYPCNYQGIKINWRIAKRKLADPDRSALHGLSLIHISEPTRPY